MTLICSKCGMKNEDMMIVNGNSVCLKCLVENLVVYLREKEKTNGIYNKGSVDLL